MPVVKKIAFAAKTVAGIIVTAPLVGVISTGFVICYLCTRDVR